MGIQLEELISETTYDEALVEISSKDLLINKEEEQTSTAFLRHQIHHKSIDSLSKGKLEVVFVFEKNNKIVEAKVTTVDDGSYKVFQDGVKLHIKDIDCKQLLDTKNFGHFVLAENAVLTPSDFLPSIFKYA